ncbi:MULTISPECIES: SDR family NAD(P)-dependent oxidoreductase [unclassified Mycobacterium]|uniref:SDR family NAD(P)-dependent oxidoreductase n=1 Tax=unclassified Mycobacterium TaxID=2642494 RepID=UPI0004258C35|nr:MULTISPECIES: SDR family NAD(P)-dependent oxidoreductase [unclassified Mycobacterium]
MIEAPQVTYEERTHPLRAVMIVIEAAGIGQVAAAQLAAQGHLVLLGGRRIAESERFAAQLRDRGGSAFAAHLDLADPRSINEFLAAAHYLIGTPDVLITDVGLAGPAGESPDGAGVGAQTLATRVIPAMIARGSGDVVLVGPEFAGVHCATAQHKVDAWLAALDAEFVGTGVRASAVRSVRPGPGASTAAAGRLLAGMATEPRLRLVEMLPAVGAGR